jgi:diacylglycerol kinase
MSIRADTLKRMNVPPTMTDHGPGDGPRPRRTWKEKFGDAFRGIKFGVRGHSSFFVHFFFAALVVAAAIALGCGLVEWCLLLLCIGLVLAAELFNSAIETLFRGLDEKSKARGYRALDIAAGAVLVASLTAALVGGIIFFYRLADVLGWQLPDAGW